MTFVSDFRAANLAVGSASAVTLKDPARSAQVESPVGAYASEIVVRENAADLSVRTLAAELGELGELGDLGDLGDLGLGELGGFGPSNGPELHMPGFDRMDGDGPNGGGVFAGGRWDFGPKGFSASGSAGGTITSGKDGIGFGFKFGGGNGIEPGVATGGPEDGSVKTPSDAKGAASAATGGSNNAPGGTGAPEGLDWSRGTSTKEPSTTTSTTKEPDKDYNDLGTSTNAPEDEQPEQDTAVASNDDPKDNGAGKPNPDAMPNPEGSGGGTPRSSGLFSSQYMPNPEDAGGGSPRSRALRG